LTLLLKRDVPLCVSFPVKVYVPFTVKIFSVLFVGPKLVVFVPSVKVNELHTTEPEEDPEILFEFITF
jgi:hypothetical protein